LAANQYTSSILASQIEVYGKNSEYEIDTDAIANKFELDLIHIAKLLYI